MTHLPFLDVAAIVAWSTAALAALGAATLRLTPADKPAQPGDEPRLFIPPPGLDDPSGLLRIAPILIGADAWHCAEGPTPAELGPGIPRNYWPHWAPYPSHYATTTKDHH